MNQVTQDQVYLALAKVRDPEIPMLSVLDLGIIRKVEIASSIVSIKVTPTYSGCPALKLIEDSIVETLRLEGLPNVKIERAFSPAWSSDWISAEGRKKLKEFGIAPPLPCSENNDLLVLIKPKAPQNVPCPFCDSLETNLQSNFGSTACKALYYCKICKQPFEYFKTH